MAVWVELILDILHFERVQVESLPIKLQIAAFPTHTNVQCREGEGVPGVQWPVLWDQTQETLRQQERNFLREATVALPLSPKPYFSSILIT